MNDRPSAEELVAAVREYLRDEVVPAAADHHARFRALIAANVLAIVGRELASDREDGDGAGSGGAAAELASLRALLGEDSGERGGDPAGHAGDELPGSAPSALLEANRRLAEHIRVGAADSGVHARTVREFVRTQVERKLAVNNPAFLERFVAESGEPTAERQ